MEVRRLDFCVSQSVMKLTNTFMPGNFLMCLTQKFKCMNRTAITGTRERFKANFVFSLNAGSPLKLADIQHYP